MAAHDLDQIVTDDVRRRSRIARLVGTCDACKVAEVHGRKPVAVAARKKFGKGNAPGGPLVTIALQAEVFAIIGFPDTQLVHQRWIHRGIQRDGEIVSAAVAVNREERDVVARIVKGRREVLVPVQPSHSELPIPIDVVIDTENNISIVGRLGVRRKEVPPWTGVVRQRVDLL